MSLMMMTEAFRVKVGNPARKLVLLKLADNANDQGECWPSYGHIARECEMGRSTVRAHIKALEEAGFLKIQYRRKGDTNQSNLYLLSLSEGKPIQRVKQVRASRSRNDHKIDPGQMLTPVNSQHTPGQELTHPRSGIDRGVGQELAPEPVSKNLSLNQSGNHICATALREGFDIFYNAGLPKKSRARAEQSFKTQSRKHGDPVAFGKMLAENIKGRLGTGELGFDAMHPSTYLNQQRWLDEVQVAASADPAIPACPHAEILEIWNDTCAQHKGKAPHLLDWQGTRSAEALAERWAEFYAEDGSGRYSDTAGGLEWWRMALQTIAGKQDFRQSDATIWDLFYKTRFSKAANGKLSGQGGATR